jgi:hypothetical protein
MSFQVYLQAFSHGEPTGIALQRIRDAFPAILNGLEDDYWQVTFSADAASDVFLQFLSGSAELVHSISFDRLHADKRLWHGMYQLLLEHGAVFYFPGNAAPLIRHQGAYDQLPADLRQSLGTPVIVSDALAIARHVEMSQVQEYSGHE